jgi:hypothetical protein
VGQVIYTPWCDERGAVIDDGTVTRLGEEMWRWTAADPNLRWFRQNAAGLDVDVEDVSEQVASLALQGPTSAGLLQAVAEADIAGLRYFRMTEGTIAGVPVHISRTGYTGDLGYEIWMPAGEALAVWDAIVAAGAPFDLHPAGMLALDVARIEAGLLLIDVDFVGSRKALTDAQRYTPFELGLGRLVAEGKGPYVGRQALDAERRRGPKRQIVGLEVSWDAVESLFAREGLPIQVPVDGLACGRAGVSPRPAGGQSDVDDLVARAQEAGGARHDRRAARGPRHRARDRDHGGGRPPPGAGRCRADAILQPRAQDSGAAGACGWPAVWPIAGPPCGRIMMPGGHMPSFSVRAARITVAVLLVSMVGAPGGAQPAPARRRRPSRSAPTSGTGSRRRSSIARRWRRSSPSETSAQIKGWGMDHIRVPVDYPLFASETDRETFSEEGLSWIDKAVGWTKDAGLTLILDLHHLPGHHFMAEGRTPSGPTRRSAATRTRSGGCSPCATRASRT